MQKLVTIGGFNETEIRLETGKGRSIPNSQSHEISRSELGHFAQFEQKYLQVTFRTPPNPIYNCHGLTFASSRTSITESAALHTILGDDGYTEVHVDEALPGDVVLYHTETGDIEHSAIVVSVEPQNALRVPLVVSKWGKYREVVHWVHVCPYDPGYVRYYRVTRWD